MCHKGACHMGQYDPFVKTSTCARPQPYSWQHTLHLKPYSPHPVPYTLHPTPYTLNPQPYTLHPTPTTSRTPTCKDACPSARGGCDLTFPERESVWAFPIQDLWIPEHWSNAKKVRNTVGAYSVPMPMDV